MPRYVHFRNRGDGREAVWGLLTAAGVLPLTSSPVGAVEPPEPASDLPLALDALTLLPPANPSKIVCVGRNYRAHAAELGNEVPEEPLIFLKPVSALVGHEGAIEHPRDQSQLVHHEGELAVVIGRRTRGVSADSAWDQVAGYTLMNDVTARDIQHREGRFTRAKGFDTFAPLGPWLDTDFHPDSQRLCCTVRRGGSCEVRQDGRLSQMIFDVGTLVAFISSIMTLEPGDIIATGTPAGVGPLIEGDEVEVSIDGLGVLRNHVVRRDSRRQ